MLFQKKKKAVEIDRNHLPRHIAVVMDGNGRWAQKRGLPRTMGHSAGSETFQTDAEYLSDLGVEYFTVYAFSTENWKRPKEEVQEICACWKNICTRPFGKCGRKISVCNFSAT